MWTVVGHDLEEAISEAAANPATLLPRPHLQAACIHTLLEQKAEGVAFGRSQISPYPRDILLAHRHCAALAVSADGSTFASSHGRVPVDGRGPEAETSPTVLLWSTATMSVKCDLYAGLPPP